MKTATQTATQITPGPWKVWRSIVDGSVNVANHAGEYVSLVGRTNGASDDQRIESDARLIAAAPEMLAALKHAIALADTHAANVGPTHKRSPECCVSYNLCVAAIAKAEGVS